MTTTTRRAVRIAIVAAVVTYATTSIAQQHAPHPPGDVDACANAAEESQALRRDGKLTQARERLVVCARASCPAFIQKDCTTWLVEVEKVLPSIVLRAIDPEGKDVAMVRVLVDGKVLTEKLDGRPLSVDPGEHVFTYEAAGQATATETLLIRQGEVNRLVSITFASQRAPASTTTQPSSDSSTPPNEKSQGSAIPTLSWILGGTGIGLVGAGALMWIMGKSDHSSMESGCATTRSCSQDDVDSAQTRLVIGDVAMGIGLVAIGAAVVLALVSPTIKSKHAASFR